MLQVPAVGHFVLPAHVAGVLPQEAYLVLGVPGVPQGVPQMLAGPRSGFHGLEVEKGVGEGVGEVGGGLCNIGKRPLDDTIGLQTR